MTTEIQLQSLEDYEDIIQRGLDTFIDVGNALLEIRDSRLYKASYSTFEDYCKERWGWERRHAYRLIDAAQVVSNVSNWTQILPTTESQARPLTQLEPEQQREVWGLVMESGDKVTASRVQQEVDKILKPHVANNSGNNEWYTPSVYIEAARKVMGSIDCDPASSEIANEVVKATMYYTCDEDGTTKEWTGNIWMNPPYSQPLITAFCDLLVKKYVGKEIQQACVLVNNATETRFYQAMLSVCSAVCFLKGRVKFVDREGIESGAPLQGQTVLYFGENLKPFTEYFQEFGVILYGR